MKILSIDHETYCEADLLKVGTDVYSRDPSCELLMSAFALDDYAVEQWVPAEGEKMPADLRDMLRDPKIKKRAWNKPFEWAIFANVLDMVIPHREWRDTMIMAMACSMPGKLSQVAPILRLPETAYKDARGKLLIRTFCQPRKPSKMKPWRRNLPHHEPEKWTEFKLYNKQDVEAERAVADELQPWDLPKHEWELWALDQEINQRGLPINMKVVQQALEISEQITIESMQRMTELTGLENPNSRNEMLGWLKTMDYQFDDLKKGHVQRELDKAKEEREKWGDRPGDAEYIEVLELRQETSKASIKKFDALDRATGPEPSQVPGRGRLRNSFQFAGAQRTWRWGGRIYQPQNLVRPPKWIEKIIVAAVMDLERHKLRALAAIWGRERLMDLISACVRPVVQARPGFVLVDADLNAIENRVLGWMAEDDKILDVFKKDQDPYIAFAVYMFHQAYDELMAEYKAGDGSKRTIAKPGVLGCGYGLSAGYFYEDETTGEIIGTGLLGYATSLGVKLTEAQSTLSVSTFRNTFERTVSYWDEIELAAKRCIRNKKSYDAGPVWFEIDGPFMRMHLPSGRSLFYVRPKLEIKMMPWGKKKEVITYEGLNDKKMWTRLMTRGAKLLENGDQGISRDVLSHGMTLADKEGLDICGHVHDQAFGEVPEDDAAYWLKLLEECMGETPKWAKGLPLKAKGHVSKFFIKD